MKKIAVLTSGGDAPGMNAAVRAVIRMGIAKGYDVYGIYRGYAGLIDGEIEHMSVSSVADILHRGGTILRTARCKEFETEDGRLKAKANLDKLDIDSLIVIGGDGTLRGAIEFSKLGINVMAVPGTIDNDLGYTDFTIGFDTAVNTVLSAINNIRDTSSSHERTTVIEVMGRNSGDIALFAAAAGGAESVLVPEVSYDIDKICEKIIAGHKRGKLHNIIVKAEGVDISTEELVKVLSDRTDMEAKEVVLSYLQRGGSPTASDRLLAERTAAKAVELIDAGERNKAVGISGTELAVYNLEEALKMKKPFREELANLVEVLS